MVAEERRPLELPGALLGRLFVFRPARLCEFDADEIRHPQLFFQPDRHRFRERRKPRRCVIEVGFEQAIELENRFIVEADLIELLDGESSLFETELDGARREARIVFDASEALLLSCRDDLAVNDDARCGIVIERRDSEDSGHRTLSTTTGRAAGRGPKTWRAPGDRRAR